MALRIDAANEIAQCTKPWTGGDFTVAFWLYRMNTSNRTLWGMYDTDDATPEQTGDPRIRLFDSGDLPTAEFYSTNQTADQASTTRTSGVWEHYCAKYTATGSTITSVEVYFKGVTAGSPGTGGRDMTANGTLDVFRIGSDTANPSMGYFAHFAYYASALSSSQITELQTKQPDVITGATPLIYAKFLADATNSGSGGSTYDFTLTGCDINATVDGSLPALSSTPASGGAGPRFAMLGIG